MTKSSIEARELVAGSATHLTEEEKLAERMKAFGSAVRLRILKILASAKERIINVTRLVELVGVDQSCINRHVHVLVNAGFLRLAEGSKRGKPHCYVVEQEVIRCVLRDLLSYTGIAGAS